MHVCGVFAESLSIGEVTQGREAEMKVLKDILSMMAMEIMETM